VAACRAEPGGGSGTVAVWNLQRAARERLATARGEIGGSTGIYRGHYGAESGGGGDALVGRGVWLAMGSVWDGGEPGFISG
jgi:hypothetical protein